MNHEFFIPFNTLHYVIETTEKGAWYQNIIKILFKDFLRKIRLAYVTQ